jgi:hypothetical protein
MSLDNATPNPYPAAPVAAPAAGGSSTGMISLAIGALSLLALVIVKIIAATPLVPSDQPAALVIGILGLLAIVPIGLAIVLGHVALARAKRSGVGALIAGAALALGYAQLVLYIGRLLTAAVAASTFPSDSGGFVDFIVNLYLWA